MTVSRSVLAALQAAREPLDRDHYANGGAILNAGLSPDEKYRMATTGSTEPPVHDQAATMLRNAGVADASDMQKSHVAQAVASRDPARIQAALHAAMQMHRPGSSFAGRYAQGGAVSHPTIARALALIAQPRGHFNDGGAVAAAPDFSIDPDLPPTPTSPAALDANRKWGDAIVHEGSSIANGIASAVTLPRDVMQGTVDPMSDQGLQRAFSLATMLPAGGAPMAERGALGSAGGAVAHEAAAPAAAAAGPSLDDLMAAWGLSPSAASEPRLPPETAAELQHRIDSLNPNNLPMDQAARMSRAQDLGFDTATPLYHGTSHQWHGTGFRETDGLRGERATFLTPDPEVATAYSSARHSEDGAILPVFARMRNPLVVDFAGAGHSGLKDAIEAARSNGHDALIAHNVSDISGYNYDEVPQTQVAVFDPRNIRSVHATFDPTMEGSSDLLSAGGLGALPNDDRPNRAHGGAVSHPTIQRAFAAIYGHRGHFDDGGDAGSGGNSNGGEGSSNGEGNSSNSGGNEGGYGGGSGGGFSSGAASGSDSSNSGGFGGSSSSNDRGGGFSSGAASGGDSGSPSSSGGGFSSGASSGNDSGASGGGFGGVGGAVAGSHATGETGLGNTGSPYGGMGGTSNMSGPAPSSSPYGGMGSMSQASPSSGPSASQGAFGGFGSDGSVTGGAFSSPHGDVRGADMGAGFNAGPASISGSMQSPSDGAFGSFGSQASTPAAMSNPAGFSSGDFGNNPTNNGLATNPTAAMSQHAAAEPGEDGTTGLGEVSSDKAFSTFGPHPASPYGSLSTGFGTVGTVPSSVAASNPNATDGLSTSATAFGGFGMNGYDAGLAAAHPSYGVSGLPGEVSGFGTQTMPGFDNIGANGAVTGSMMGPTGFSGLGGFEGVDGGPVTTAVRGNLSEPSQNMGEMGLGMPDAPAAQAASPGTPEDSFTHAMENGLGMAEAQRIASTPQEKAVVDAPGATPFSPDPTFTKTWNDTQENGFSVNAFGAPATAAAPSLTISGTPQTGLGAPEAAPAAAPATASPYSDQASTVNADGYEATPANAMAYGEFGRAIGYGVVSLPGDTPIGDAVPSFMAAAHPDMFAGVQTVGDLRANLATISATAAPAGVGVAQAAAPVSAPAAQPSAPAAASPYGAPPSAMKSYDGTDPSTVDGLHSLTIHGDLGPQDVAQGDAMMSAGVPALQGTPGTPVSPRSVIGLQNAQQVSDTETGVSLAQGAGVPSMFGAYVAGDKSPMAAYESLNPSEPQANTQTQGAVLGMPAGTLAAGIHTLEGGVLNGQVDPQNPKHYGPAQFDQPTFSDAAKAHPELGISPSMSMFGSTPDQYAAITNAHINDVQDALTAKGFDPTPANTYLGWNLGIGGALKALAAGPDATLSQAGISQAVQNANPSIYGGMRTIGDVQANIAARMANGSLSTTAGPSAATTANGFSGATPTETSPSVGDALGYSPSEQMAGYEAANPDAFGLGQIADSVPTRTNRYGAISTGNFTKGVNAAADGPNGDGLNSDQAGFSDPGFVGDVRGFTQIGYTGLPTMAQMALGPYGSGMPVGLSGENQAGYTDFDGKPNVAGPAPSLTGDQPGSGTNLSGDTGAASAAGNFGSPGPALGGGNSTGQAGGGNYIPYLTGGSGSGDGSTSSTSSTATSPAQASLDPRAVAMQAYLAAMAGMPVGATESPAPIRVSHRTAHAPLYSPMNDPTIQRALGLI